MDRSFELWILSLHNLKLNLLSMALEYWREDIFQSIPLLIIALNSP